MDADKSAQSFAAEDQTWSSDTALAHAWHELVASRARIVDSFSTTDRLGLVLWMRPDLVARPLPERQVRVLENMLFAGRQKIVGIELGMSGSSVTGLGKQALASIGLSCLPSQVPLPIFVSAYAARRPYARCDVRVTEQFASSGVYRTISIQRPDTWLAERLTPAQTVVTALRIDSKSLSEIAASCGISVHTVANHLAAAYKKLQTSGRLELLSRIATEYLQEPRTRSAS